MRDMPRHARGREPAAGVALSREGCSACARTPRIARSKEAQDLQLQCRGKKSISHTQGVGFDHLWADLLAQGD